MTTTKQTNRFFLYATRQTGEPAKITFCMPGILFTKLTVCPSGCYTYNINTHKCRYGCIYIQTATIGVRLWAAVVSLSANTVTHNTADLVGAEVLPG